MSIERRLAVVEAALGIDPSIYRETGHERAERAVYDGRATQLDFEICFTPGIHEIRSMIVVRSRLFRQARATGLEPYAPDPKDIAASVAALPLGQEPRPNLVERLTRAASRPPGAGSPPSGRSRYHRARTASEFEEWVQAGAMLVALGAPDGLPLRRAMAAGEHDDADRVVDQCGLREFAGPPVPSFLRWLLESEDCTVTTDLSMYSDEFPYT